MGDDILEIGAPRPKFGRHQPLFARNPTDEEKRFYRRQWGGITPLRCLAGMLFMFVLGFAAGYVLIQCPGTECQTKAVIDALSPS